jgi:colicin import membrane protein
MMLALPMSVIAQNVWEKPKEEKVEKAEEVKKPNKDEKYLRGAVPIVDGDVQWTLDVDVPGKSAQDIYDKMFKTLTDLTKSEGQLEGSAVTLVNKQDHIVVANVREWLLFSSSLLSLDRTKFNYTLIARCSDGHLNMTMNRISYKYDEERTNQVYKAEEWISDDAAVNKKNTKLYRGSAKFRRKTIDRKDQIFETIRNVLKE